jgi:hypothetical protein
MVGRQSLPVKEGCTRCMIDCDCNPSVLQFIGINASDAFHNLKAGRLLSAVKNLFDARNLTSLKAVSVDRRWIGGV